MHWIGHYLVAGLCLAAGWFAGGLFSHSLKVYWPFCARVLFRLPCLLIGAIGLAGYLAFVAGVGFLAKAGSQALGIDPGNTLVASVVVGILLGACKLGIVVFFKAMVKVEEPSEADYREVVVAYKSLGWRELISFRARSSGDHLGVMTAKFNEPIPTAERIKRAVEEARLEAQSANPTSAPAKEIAQTEAPPVNETAAPSPQTGPAKAPFEYPEVIAEKSKLARELGKDWLRGVRRFQPKEKGSGINSLPFWWFAATLGYIAALTLDWEVTPGGFAYYYGPVGVLIFPILFLHWREKWRSSAFRPGKLVMERQEFPGGIVQGRYVMENSRRDEDLVVTLWCLRRDTRFQELDSPILNEKVVWFAQTTGTCGPGKSVAFSFELPTQAPPSEQSLAKETGHIVAWLLFIKSENPFRPYCEEVFLELPAAPEKTEGDVQGPMPHLVWPQECSLPCARVYLRAGQEGKAEVFVPQNPDALEIASLIALVVPGSVMIACLCLGIPTFWPTLAIWLVWACYSLSWLRKIFVTTEIRSTARGIEVCRNFLGRRTAQIHPADLLANEPKLIDEGCAYRVGLPCADKTRKLDIALRTPLDSLLLLRHLQRGMGHSDKALNSEAQPDLTLQKIPMRLQSPQEISRRQASQIVTVFKLIKDEEDAPPPRHMQ